MVLLTHQNHAYKCVCVSLISMGQIIPSLSKYIQSKLLWRTPLKDLWNFVEPAGAYRAFHEIKEFQNMYLELCYIFFILYMTSQISNEYDSLTNHSNKNLFRVRRSMVELAKVTVEALWKQWYILRINTCMSVYLTIHCKCECDSWSPMEAMVHNRTLFVIEFVCPSIDNVTVESPKKQCKL